MPTPIFGDDYVICITECKVEIRLGMKTTKNIKTAITERPPAAGPRPSLRGCCRQSGLGRRVPVTRAAGHARGRARAGPGTARRPRQQLRQSRVSNSVSSRIGLPVSTELADGSWETLEGVKLDLPLSCKNVAFLPLLVECEDIKNCI